MERPLDQDVANAMRRWRARSGLTLRAAATRVTERGGRLTHSTLARIEQGHLRPGWAELLHLTRIYGIPEEWLFQILSMGASHPDEESLTSQDLLDRGLQHWRKGEIPQALGCVLAVRESKPRNDKERHLRQRAVIELATYARGLGWLRFARSLLEEVLCEPVEEQLQIRALVLGASVWRGLGSQVMAQALIDHAARLLRPDSNPREVAWVLQQKAKIVAEAGHFDEAGNAVQKALRIYREVGDTANRVRATLLQIQVEEGQGDPAGAMASADRALALTRKEGLKDLEAHALLEVGRLCVAQGQSDQAIQTLRQALALALTLGDANVEFHGYYRLFKAHEAVGNTAEAELALSVARHLVTKIDDTSREADDVRRSLRPAARAAGSDAGGSRGRVA